MFKVVVLGIMEKSVAYILAEGIENSPGFPKGSMKVVVREYEPGDENGKTTKPVTRKK